MFKRKILIFLSLLAILSIILVSSVSAADENMVNESMNLGEDSVLEIDDDENILAADEEENSLESGEEGKLITEHQWFSDIQNQIDQAREGSTIYLSGTYYGRFIAIDGQNIKVSNQPIIIKKPIKIVGTGEGAILKGNINSAERYPVFYIFNTTNVVLDSVLYPASVSTKAKR